MLEVKSEDPAVYRVDRAPTLEREDAIIAEALAILHKRIHRAGHYFSSPSDVASYVKCRVGGLEHEAFGLLFLNAQFGLIAAEELPRGTLCASVVHPREVVKAALRHNARAVVLYHNHPSGQTKPSKPDEMLTQALKKALDLVEVNVLDHLVVAGNEHFSFAEHGMI